MPSPAACREKDKAHPTKQKERHVKSHPPPRLPPSLAPKPWLDVPPERVQAGRGPIRMGLGGESAYKAVKSRLQPRLRGNLKNDERKCGNLADETLHDVREEAREKGRAMTTHSISMWEQLVDAKYIVLGLVMCCVVALLVYGRQVAIGCAAWSFVLGTAGYAFDRDVLGMHLVSLGMASGAVLGSACMQRHDTAVLLCLCAIIGVLAALAPLTVGDGYQKDAASSFALLSGGFMVLFFILAGYFLGVGAVSSVVAVSVPAWVCGVVGGLSTLDTFMLTGVRRHVAYALIAALSVLAGALGASHDPVLMPGIALGGA